MKRILAIFLALALLFALSACGTEEKGDPEKKEIVELADAEELQENLADSLLGFGLQKMVDAFGSESVSVGIEDHDSVEGLALVYIEVALAGGDSEDAVISEDAVVRMAYSIVADSNRLIAEADAKAYAESLGRDFSDFTELKISNVRNMYFSPEVEVASGSLAPDELTILQGAMVQIAEAYAAQSGSTAARKADFVTVDIEGKSVDGLELFSKTEATLLCIWTSWSIPSEKELIQLQTLSDKLSDENIQVVLLLWDASSPDSPEAETAKEVMEENDIDLPCLLFTNSMTNVFNKSGYPSSFLIGSDGTLLTGELWGVYTVEDYILWIEEQTGINTPLS